MVCWRQAISEPVKVPDGLLPILVLIAIVIVYTIVKVIDYSRTSNEQWRQVDKSKLKKWEDDDD